MTSAAVLVVVYRIANQRPTEFTLGHAVALLADSLATDFGHAARIVFAAHPGRSSSGCDTPTARSTRAGSRLQPRNLTAVQERDSVED